MQKSTLYGVQYSTLFAERSLLDEISKAGGVPQNVGHEEGRLCNMTIKASDKKAMVMD